jgi:hypothetical protein
MKISREMERWVRDNLAKGHSPETLRKKLREYGYDPAIVDYVVGKKSRIPWKPGIKLIFASLVLVLFIAISYYFFMIPPLIVGEFTKNMEIVTASFGDYRIQTDLPEDRCYWIRTTSDGTNYILEILEYESSDNNCIGELINRTEIVTTQPVNILGSDCICGKSICDFKNELRENRVDLNVKGC